MDRLRHQPPGDADPNERLAALTERCAQIVQRWAEISERHAGVVNQFEAHLAEWTDTGARLQRDASQRFQELQAVIQQEWQQIRQIQDAPVRQLQEQATNLTQVCIATADAAQRNFERSEARLVSIERDIDRRMSELAGQFQRAVTELRAQSPRVEPAGAGGAPWSLESVTRLHQELRDPGSTEGALVQAGQTGPPAPREPAGLLPEAASALSDRISSLERALADRQSQIQDSVARTARATRAWQWAGAVFVVLLGLTAAFALRTQGQVRAAAERAEQAERETAAARDLATREATAAREAAALEIKEATGRAVQAQLAVDVLAAPDVLRYNLTGRDSLAGASAELRFSRSRGVVFSGNRIPAPPAGSTYQIWLITRRGPVKATTFSPGRTGLATVALAPFDVPRPVTGAMVTIEPAAGSDAPSGDPVLARPTPLPS